MEATESYADTLGCAAFADLVDVVLLAESVEDDVDLIEHVHHLHGCDVDADLVKLDHVAEQDGHIWEDLGYKHTYVLIISLCEQTPVYSPGGRMRCLCLA